MKNLLMDARGLRRASAAVAMIAGSILLVAPVAGASSSGETPEPAAHGQAHADANAPQHGAEGGGSAAVDHGSQASEPGASAPPEHSNAGGNAATAPRPSSGAAEPESPGASGTHKHTICHRTRSATNPYVLITVDFHAVDGELVEATSDHAERHDGVVFEPGMSDGEWGDIIPPFTFDGVPYDGQNWGEDGQAIFEAGCELPEPGTETGAGTDVDTDTDVETDTGTDEDAAPAVGGVDETPEAGAEQPGTEVAGDAVTRGEAPEAGGALGTAVTATPETQVLGAMVTRTPSAAGAQISSLPRTGNGTGLLAAVGAGLVGLGFLLVRGTRRTAITS